MSDSQIEAVPRGLEEKPGFAEKLYQLFRVFLPPGVRLAGAGIQFISTILIARHLGDSGSALFFFWSAILTSFAIVATFGLENLVLRNVPRLKRAGAFDELDHYLAGIRGIILTLSFAIGLGLVCYAFLKSAGEGAQLHWWYALLPLTLAAMALLVVSGETLKGLSRPVSGVFFGHFIPVSLFCVLIVLYRHNLSSPMLLFLYAVAYLSGAVFVRLGPSRAIKGTFAELPRWRTVRPTLMEGAPIFSANALGALCYVVPLALLEFSRPAAEVSHLTTAFRISILLSVLATAIHSVFAPGLSCAAEQSGNLRGVFTVYVKSTLFTLAALALPAVVGIMFPEWVMSIFGDEFRDAAANLRWLLITCLLSMMLGPVYQLLIMTGNTRFLAISGVAKLVIVAVLSSILIPPFGGVGMVLAMGVAFLGEEIVGLIWVVMGLRRHARKGEAA